MTKLSVNINKIATLRNARGGNVPNLLKVASDIEKFGADGITVHPRPDERHIKYADVYDLAKIVTTEFNIEGYPNEKFIELVLAVKPTQVTLVPDGPDVLTSNAGWNIETNKDFLKTVITRFKKAGIRVSVFLEPDPKMVSLVPEIGADRIELYTEQYAVNYSNNKETAIAPFIEAAETANDLNIGINAGHDLSLENLAYFSDNIPNLLEVSIGHALIGNALYYGLEKTVEIYKEELK
jgi:pyridoxine 5-phosphate synthase